MGNQEKVINTRLQNDFLGSKNLDSPVGIHKLNEEPDNYSESPTKTKR